MQCNYLLTHCWALGPKVTASLSPGATMVTDLGLLGLVGLAGGWGGVEGRLPICRLDITLTLLSGARTFGLGLGLFLAFLALFFPVAARTVMYGERGVVLERGGK